MKVSTNHRLPRQRSNAGETRQSQPIRDFFVPAGVRLDYLPSRAWKVARSFTSAVAGYTASAAALQAAGMAPGPLSFSLAVMLRDGVGNLGRILASTQAKRADQEPQKLSRQGEILESSGIAAESLLALVPGAFLAIAPAAQILKAVGDTMKHAAEPVLENPQAVNDNIGEVRAKNELQETLAAAAGGVLAFGLDSWATNQFGAAATPVIVGAALGLRYLSLHNYLGVTSPPPDPEHALPRPGASAVGPLSSS